MAVILTGASVCPICGDVMDDSKEIYGFPPFVANKNDPLILFNDEGFHYKCLTGHPLGQKAITLAEQFILRTRPKNRICEIGRNIIERPDDYIFIPLLTSDEQDPLYKFNFMNIDRNNLGK